MFLSDKQGNEFKKTFNKNVIQCKCFLLCTCDITHDKIIEGFSNNNLSNTNLIKSYIGVNKLENNETETGINLNDNNKKTENSHKTYYEKALNYINNNETTNTNENIKKYINKNVQVTNLGDVDYKYNKCMASDDINKFFNKQTIHKNPSIKECSIRAANYNRNAFIVKNNICYISKPNIKVNNIPNNSYYASNTAIKGKRYNNNNTKHRDIKASVFKNGDFGIGYTENGNIIPTYSMRRSWNSTVSSPTTGCNLNGSNINVKDAIYINNFLI